MRTLEEEINSGGREIKVGSFIVREITDGNYWIEHDNGEGLIASKEELEEIILNFFEENFG